MTSKISQHTDYLLFNDNLQYYSAYYALKLSQK